MRPGRVAHLPWEICPGWSPLSSLRHTWPAVQVCLGRSSTQSQLTSCFTPKCCKANSQHTGECNPGTCRWSKLFHRSSGVAVAQIRWADRGHDALSNRRTFPQLQQGILAQQTPPFLTPAQRVLFIGACCLLFGFEHCLVMHPLGNILYSTAEHVQMQAASLVSSQESWPEPLNQMLSCPTVPRAHHSLDLYFSQGSHPLLFPFQTLFWMY